MTISVEAIYEPLHQFFLQKFGPSDNAPVIFRFAEIPVGLYDSDFIVPLHADWGPFPPLAMEQFSNLVDKTTRLDIGGHGVWLDTARFSDLYHDEMLAPALPFLLGANEVDKQLVIDTVSQMISDARQRWENCKALSAIIVGSEFRPSSPTPPGWWNKSDADVWMPQEFQIQGAAVTVTDQPPDQMLRMKIPDAALQSFLELPVNPPDKPVFSAVKVSTSAPFSEATVLSHGTLLAARPIFRAALAKSTAVSPASGAIVTAAELPPAIPHAPALTATMHSDLMTQVRLMSVGQRMELESTLAKSAPTQSISVSDVTIHFDYCLVAVDRPWIHNGFLNNKLWFIPGQAKGSLSANDGHGLPALPVGFVALKNLRIEGPWTPMDITNLEQSIQFGPFLVDSTVAGGAIGHAGIQVVGWILQSSPDWPPVDPPPPDIANTGNLN